jgi:hypothetical protein
MLPLPQTGMACRNGRLCREKPRALLTPIGALQKSVALLKPLAIRLSGISVLEPPILLGLFALCARVQIPSTRSVRHHLRLNQPGGCQSIRKRPWSPSTPSIRSGNQNKANHAATAQYCFAKPNAVTAKLVDRMWWLIGILFRWAQPGQSKRRPTSKVSAKSPNSPCLKPPFRRSEVRYSSAGRGGSSRASIQLQELVTWNVRSAHTCQGGVGDAGRRFHPVLA